MSPVPPAAGLTPLAEAADPHRYGGKAAQLAAALGSGLPVPDGYALDWRLAGDVAAGEPGVCGALRAAGLPAGLWAVRSSAVGEDSGAASFAGVHVTVLGQVGIEAVLDAVASVHASATSQPALDYRELHAISSAPRMAVVVQEMVDAEVAGVMFTRNPVTGAAERLVEASWGLGEAVAAGLVTPDQYRIAPDGSILELRPGEKDLALRLVPGGGVEEIDVPAHRVAARCLADTQLEALHRLALACDRVFGGDEHDIEFGFAGERLYLLQRRPITHA